MFQDKQLITFKLGKKLTYALSVEIMTLTLRITVGGKHAKMQLSLKMDWMNTYLQLFIDRAFCIYAFIWHADL